MSRNEMYWQDIPVGAENAVTRDELCARWGVNERTVRQILHDLSATDNGDNYVLIRSGHGRGFYKTDNEAALLAYKRECMSKGRSLFAPVKKINRILSSDAEALQYSAFNNLKTVRVSKGMSQPEVCLRMKEYDRHFDVPTLSKMENGAVYPTPYQLLKLAAIYGVKPSELLAVDLYAADIYAQI